MMRVLITGPTGFIGRHCLARLMNEDCEIHAVSRRPPLLADDRVHWHCADLREAAAARHVVTTLRPTHLLHLAWEATPGVYVQSPENFRWLKTSLEMATAFGETGGERFLGAGSAAEYENGHARCFEEATPTRSSSIYGKCKAACWLGIEALGQHYGFAAVWGRIFLPYGPGDSPARLIPSVLATLAEKQPIDTTHGHQLRDFIYAPDLGDLLVRLLLSPEGGVFNIGTGRGTTVRSVITYLADQLGGRELLRFGAIEMRPNEPPSQVADMTKVESLLGWSAPTVIERGLDRTLAEWRSDRMAFAGPAGPLSNLFPLRPRPDVS
jgi:nucleoside-diphosphate-sugar epimerase